MIRVRMARFSVLFAGLLLLAGCASRSPDLARLAPDDLYRQAISAYEAEDYDEAIRLLEVFVQQHVGDPRAPEARLTLARAHTQEEEYITAATHFQRLLNDFPSSPLALEARSGICASYYELSPRPALDQEYTRSALLHCESVAENFPGTPQGEQASEYVEDLRLKLARKAYNTGVFYLKRKAYDAAVVYFTEVVEQFPRTSVAPAALSQLVETYEQIGYVEEAQEARERLLRDYPESPQAQALRT
jgi:outer membrane protein assembly factor BamD